MSLPKISIVLKAIAENSVNRSTRGIVMLVLQDTVTGVKSYGRLKNVTETYTEDNKAIISKCFNKYGVKNLKVVCYNTESETVEDALEKISGVKFNYLAAPGVTESEDKTKIVDFIKEQRTSDNILTHAVLYNKVADHEGIINFVNETVKDSTGEHTGAEYCVDVACQCAVNSIKRSITSLPVGDVTFATVIDDMDSDAGKLFLYWDNDFESYIFSTGVNSKTTISTDENSSMKQIRVCEVLDMIRDDLKVNFKKNYQGKMPNTYNERKLMRDSFNIYFKSLERLEVLDDGESNYFELDLEATKDYLENTKGIDISQMSDEEILAKKIDNNVFMKAICNIADVAENFTLNLNY